MKLNDASLDDLTKVKDLSKTKAQAILDARDTAGGFKSWDDLKAIPGINDFLINSMKAAGMEV